MLPRLVSGRLLGCRRERESASCVEEEVADDVWPLFMCLKCEIFSLPSESTKITKTGLFSVPLVVLASLVHVELFATVLRANVNEFDTVRVCKQDRLWIG